MGCKTGAYRVLAQKPEGKRPLEGRRRRWKSNIKTDLEEIVWMGDDLNDLAQDTGKWAGFCECGNEPPFSIQSGEFSKWLRNC